MGQTILLEDLARPNRKRPGTRSNKASAMTERIDNHEGCCLGLDNWAAAEIERLVRLTLVSVICSIVLCARTCTVELPIALVVLPSPVTLFNSNITL